MTNYNELVDVKRFDAAKAAFEALEQAERDATAALEQATADAKSAQAAAQKAADAGANLDKLMVLEEAVEAANRKVSVAQRMAAGARLRRTDGQIKRDHEVRQAHGAAMNAAFAGFLATRQEAIEVFARLEELKQQHIDIGVQFKALATAAKAGVPNLIESRRELLDSRGAPMDEAEVANRLSQNQHHEWDSARASLRWVE
jgi:hypothetical protein